MHYLLHQSHTMNLNHDMNVLNIFNMKAAIMTATVYIDLSGNFV